MHYIPTTLIGRNQSCITLMDVRVFHLDAETMSPVSKSVLNGVGYKSVVQYLMCRQIAVKKLLLLLSHQKISDSSNHMFIPRHNIKHSYTHFHYRIQFHLQPMKFNRSNHNPKVNCYVTDLKQRNVKYNMCPYSPVRCYLVGIKDWSQNRSWLSKIVHHAEMGKM